MSVVAVDFETFYSKKLKYSLKGSIAEQYCRSHLFDPYMISVSDGETYWSGEPKNFNWSSLSGQTLLSHNAYFDHTVYDEMVKRKLAPQMQFEAWHCTANMTAYLCNRRSLDQAVEHMLGIKISKAIRTDAVDKHWPADFTEEQRVAMIKYAADDANWCRGLWGKFSDQWPQWERDLSDLTIRQGRRGVQIDTDLLDSYILWTFDCLRAIENQIPWIADADDEEWEDFNSKPTSSKCVAEQCRRSGIPCPPVKSEEPEEYEEWEEKYKRDHQWILCLSAWRSVNREHKTYRKMKDRLRPDGTLPFGLKYFGAHTGRWAGDAGVNFQNPRKKPILINAFGLMETNERRIDDALKFHKLSLKGEEPAGESWSIHPGQSGKWPGWVRAVIDFRALIMARPGKKLILCDLSQIEPRVLAYIAGDTAMLDMLRGGMSVYEAHARKTMGWTGGKLSLENPDMYALAKARVLSLGYQAAWEKFIVMAANYGVDITADDPEFMQVENPRTGVMETVSGYGKKARETVADFRASNPKITAIWENLDSGFKQSVGSDFFVTLPSGRRMRYEKIRASRQIVLDKKTGKPKNKVVYTCDIGGRRKPAYGGLLTENTVQAIARDVFGHHLNLLDDPGRCDVLFSAHDEAINEVDKDIKASDVEHVMSTCPEWLKGCPLGAEAKEVERYQK